MGHQRIRDAAALRGWLSNKEFTMHTVRPDKVQGLMTAANRGMKAVAADTTGDEVYAAYLTMARNAVLLARDSRRDNQDIREALMAMLLLCETPGVTQ